MDRHARSIRRPRLIASFLCAMLAVALGATLTSAQTGPDQAPDEAMPTCDPWGIDPCPSPSLAPQTLSGGFTWTMLSWLPSGGELASSEQWDSAVTASLVWDDARRLFVPTSGDYSYSHQVTGHCTGSVSGSGTLSTEPYAGAEPGIGFTTVEWMPGEDGTLGLRIGIWRDDLAFHCNATRAFPASDDVLPGNTERPYCTRVIGEPVGGGTFSVRCVEQDIEGLDVTVSGTLTLGP